MNVRKRNTGTAKTVSDCAGFTLVELIIVVAIIAVLAAVLIPQYIKYVERSRKTICESNRSKIIRAVENEHSADGSLTAVEIYQRDYAADKTCPSGGIITAGEDAGGHLTLTCSKHNAQAWNVAVVQNIKTEFDKAMEGISNMDSGALANSDSRTSAAVAALKEAGIDLEKMDANGWVYFKKSGSQEGIFCWTAVDIQNTAVDALVPVMRYNANLGTYTTWMYRVKSMTSNGYTYNVLREERAVEVDESKALTPEEKKDITGALAAYQIAMDSYTQGS